MTTDQPQRLLDMMLDIADDLYESFKEVKDLQTADKLSSHIPRCFKLFQDVHGVSETAMGTESLFEELDAPVSYQKVDAKAYLEELDNA